MHIMTAVKILASIYIGFVAFLLATNHRKDREFETVIADIGCIIGCILVIIFMWFPLR